MQENGLAVAYRDDKEVQDVVRMIGALQLANPQVWNYALNLICAHIETKFNLFMAQKLMQLVDYYRYCLLFIRVLCLLCLVIHGFLLVKYFRCMVWLVKEQRIRLSRITVNCVITSV